MMTANARLTQSIHAPARGSRESAPDESPTATSSVHMPNENARRYTKPSVALPWLPTHVSIAAITGAPHGAATGPDTEPMMNAPPARPPVPAVAARACHDDGSLIGITSNIASEASTSTFAMRK